MAAQVFGYGRVSTKEQNLERQIIVLAMSVSPRSHFSR